MEDTIMRPNLWLAVRTDYYLYAMLLPCLIYYAIFKFWPMYGLLIAFEKYSIVKGVFGSDWVGLKHFADFFRLPDSWTIIRNTLLLNVYSLAFAFPAPIVLALLLNELRSLVFKRLVQTVSYMPHFISTVVIVGMVVNFLSPSTGIVNLLAVKLFGLAEPIFFMSKAEWFRTIYIGSGIWSSIGWGSIIYLAALAGIDPTLHEAAKMDGAGRFQRILHINLPGIMPIVSIMLILAVGDIMEVGVQKIILMYNPLIYDTADVISTYVYRRGLIDVDYSFATAVGLFQSVIGLIMVVSANKLSRRFSETSLW
jgi:putative aldouronate transport system permease protein